MPPRLSILVPVYNEERTLPALLDAVEARPEVYELVVVDDGSTDATAEILACRTFQGAGAGDSPSVQPRRLTRAGLRRAGARGGTVVVYAVLPALLLIVMVAGSINGHFAFDFHQFWQGGRDWPFQETGGDVWKIALGMAALAAMTAAILSSATQLRPSWK
jgi:cellulose synthase/poly-beta-1,6-N-acetylglucosamine synthase-like glycosyltransferase